MADRATAQSIYTLADPKYLISIEEQKNTSRKTVPFKYNKIYNVDEDDTLLLDPLRIDFQKNAFYILDYGDFKVKQFKYARDTVKFVREYGNGRGRGPGQSLNASDFCVSQDGHVYILDAQTRKVDRFSNSGKHISQIATPSSVMNLACHNDTLALALADVDKHLVVIMDNNGDIIGRTKQVVEEQRKYFMGFDGFVEDDHRNGFVFVPRYPGLIFRVNILGELLYARHQIDPPRFPDIEVREMGRGRALKLKGNKDEYVYDVDVFNEKIYISCSRKQDSERKYWLDVYNLKNGSYMYSHNIDKPLDDIVFSDEHMYTNIGVNAFIWSQ